MNERIQLIESLAAQDSSVRLLVAAIIKENGCTSLRQLVDEHPDAADELIADATMIAGQLDDILLLEEMREASGFHVHVTEGIPDAGPSD